MKAAATGSRWVGVSFVVVVCCFAAAVTGSVDAATGEAASTYVLSAEYTGTYHFEDHWSVQGEKLDSVETFKWDAVGTETVKGDTGAVLNSTYTLTASGRLYQNSTNGGHPRIEDCTFKALPTAQLKSMDSIVSIQPRVIGKLTGFGVGFQMPDTVGYQVGVTDKNGNCNMGNGSTALISNTATQGTVDTVTGLLQNNLWLRAFGSPALEVPLGGKLRQPVDVEQEGSNSTETAKRSVHGVWILGGSVGKPVPVPTPPAAKKPCSPTAWPTFKTAQLEAEYLAQLAQHDEQREFERLNTDVARATAGGRSVYAAVLRRVGE